MYRRTEEPVSAPLFVFLLSGATRRGYQQGLPVTFEVKGSEGKERMRLVHENRLLDSRYRISGIMYSYNISTMSRVRTNEVVFAIMEKSRVNR
jgi:hypothetical protein